MRGSALFALGLASALSSGCYQLTVKSGLPPAPEPAIRGRLTGAWLNGLVDETPVLDLGRLCPAGWAEVHYEEGFLTGVINSIRGLIYTGSDVTVRCAEGPATPPPQAEVVQPAPAAAPPPPAVEVVVAPPQPVAAPAPAPPKANASWPADVAVASRSTCSLTCSTGNPPTAVDGSTAQGLMARQLGAFRACALAGGRAEGPRTVAIHFDGSGHPALRYGSGTDPQVTQCVARIPAPFVSGPPNAVFRCTDTCR